jgi:hypothetical protein
MVISFIRITGAGQPLVGTSRAKVSWWKAYEIERSVLAAAGVKETVSKEEEAALQA